MNTYTKYIDLYIKLLWTRLETNLNNKNKKTKKTKPTKKNQKQPKRETISEQIIEL